MYQGYTSLIFASRQGHSNVTRILLEKDADVNATDNHGKLDHIYI